MTSSEFVLAKSLMNKSHVYLCSSTLLLFVSIVEIHLKEFGTSESDLLKFLTIGCYLKSNCSVEQLPIYN